MMNSVYETSPSPVVENITFATEMQSTLVPPLRYRGDCIEALGQCIPKDQIGGDLMDLVADGLEVITYVADVSGHGLRAGVLMGMIKTAMRYGLLLRRPLKNLVTDLNRVLPQVKQPSMFVTMAALRFDGSEEMEYVSAGHVPLLHFRKRSNDVVRHYAQQHPLGLLAGDDCVSSRIRFDTGDILLLPTDGAVELGEELGTDEGLEVLARTMRNFNKNPLPEILELFQRAINRRGAQLDDRTLLLVRALRSAGQPPIRQLHLNDSACCEALETTWNRMLAELAAGLADD
jgi:sigma-B regulation protein RsbU (phosphoserine phosphatase)